MHRRFRHAAVAGGTLAVCLAATGLVSSATAAPAADPGLHVSYTTMGKTHVAKPNTDVKIGKSQLDAQVYGLPNAPGFSFRADLPLPPAQTSFTYLGVPYTATINFTQVGKVIGNLRPKGDAFATHSRADYTIRLSDVTIAGLPADVGDSCQTVDPVVVHASTPANKTFDLTKGGTLTSRYAIGQFADCGLYTAAVNQIVPSSGNFISLTLSNGKLG